MRLVGVARWGYYWRPTKTRARTVSHPACTIPKGVDSEAYNELNGRSAPKERPHLHHHPSAAKEKGKQCGAIVAHPSDTDIEPAAVEWRDTRYRNRHGPPGPAHRPSRRQISDEAGNTGSLRPYWTASRKPPRGSEVLPRGRAEPERYLERVAYLTHNGALASNSSPGLLALSSTVSPLVGTNGWDRAEFCQFVSCGYLLPPQTQTSEK